MKLARSGTLVVAMEASSEGISQRVTMKRKRVKASRKTAPPVRRASYNFID